MRRGDRPAASHQRCVGGADAPSLDGMIGQGTGYTVSPTPHPFPRVVPSHPSPPPRWPRPGRWLASWSRQSIDRAGVDLRTRVGAS